MGGQALPTTLQRPRQVGFLEGNPTVGKWQVCNVRPRGSPYSVYGDVQVAGLAGLLPAYRLWWSCAAPTHPLTWA